LNILDLPHPYIKEMTKIISSHDNHELFLIPANNFIDLTDKLKKNHKVASIMQPLLWLSSIPFNKEKEKRLGNYAIELSPLVIKRLVQRTNGLK
jgi:hypothetical protein